MGIHFLCEKPKARRLRVLSIEADLWLCSLRDMDGTKMRQCQDVIPEDAHVVGIVVDEMFNTVKLYIESAEFDEVPEHCCVPEWHIAFCTHWPRIGRNRELIFDGDHS